MNKQYFSFVFIIILCSGIILPNVTAMQTPWIPPTNAIAKIVTSNSTITAKNYTAHLTVTGTGGISVTGSNHQQQLFIDGSGISGSTHVQGKNLGTSGTGSFQGNFNNTMLQFYKFISANSVCAFSSNTTNVILTCTSSGGVTSINATTGALNINYHSNATANILSSGTFKLTLKQNVVLTNGSAQTFTKNLDMGQGTTQTLPNTGLVIRNPASTFGTTIKGGAVTSNQTQTLSITTSPSTISVVPFYNFTSKNQTTGTTSVGTQVMYGGGITFIPRTGTNATVSVSFITQDSTLGDGCKIDIRWGTGGVHGTNSALAGTLVGQNFKSISPTTANLSQSQGKTVLITGLTAGTKYYADLSYSALTGGTCQVYNADWYAMAP